MRRRLRAISGPAVFLTLLFAIELVFEPLPFTLALRIWLVGLAALAAGALTAAALAPFGRAPVSAVAFGPGRSAESVRPAGLDEVERAVDFASWNGADLNRRLRPILRDVAEHRLWVRHAIDLERHRARAKEMLGDPAWNLVGADRADADDGPPPRPATEVEMAAAITRLEEL